MGRMISSNATQDLSKENSFLLKYSCLLFQAKMQRRRGNLYMDFIVQLTLRSRNAEENISSTAVPCGLPFRAETHTHAAL